MTTHSTSGRGSGIKRAYRVACLFAILLTITAPLHAIACPMPECSPANSKANGQCHAMEMPKQSASSCAAPASSCCQQDQTLAQTVQRGFGSQAPDITLGTSVPENPDVVAKGFQAAVSPHADSSPPDRQSLFCT